MRALILTTVLMAALPSWATHPPAPEPGPTPTAETTAAADATAESNSSASAVAVGVGVSGAEAGANAEISGTVGGDAQASANGGNAVVTVTEQHPSTVRIKNNGALALGGTNSTSDCIVAKGAGLAGAAGSVLMNLGVIEWNCQRHQWFEEKARAGQFQEAAQIMCSGWRNKARKWLGGMEPCVASYMETAKAYYVVPEVSRSTVVHVKVDPAEARAKCEASGDLWTLREIQDDDTIIVYECRELTGKGS